MGHTACVFWNRLYWCRRSFNQFWSASCSKQKQYVAYLPYSEPNYFYVIDTDVTPKQVRLYKTVPEVYFNGPIYVDNAGGGDGTSWSKPTTLKKAWETAVGIPEYNQEIWIKGKLDNRR